VILPLMIACVLASLVARALSPESLMTEKLSRRGLRVRSDYEADVLRMTTVGDVMTTDVVTIPAGARVAEAREILTTGPHGAYPLVTPEDELAGIVARGDLLRWEDGDGRRVTDVASRDVIAVAPDDDVLSALHTMLDEEVEHLPVVEEGRLVGICTRTDILRARRHQLERERPQRGWMAGGVL
jgi:chloride channel protein, CIC family